MQHTAWMMHLPSCILILTFCLFLHLKFICPSRPDFRSPGGMYDTLQPELITATDKQRKLMELDPTYVAEKGVFMQTAFPYLEVRRPFILGVRDRKWKPTIGKWGLCQVFVLLCGYLFNQKELKSCFFFTPLRPYPAHHFAKLLHAKTGKLTRVYTQNIDGLTNAVDLPDEKVVSVHGNIGKASCENCGEEKMDFDAFCEEVEGKIKDIYNPDNGPKESKPIHCESCGKATVKPKTVLFGSSLPSEFFECAEQDLPSTDLLIVAGTSLVVSPANSLVSNVPAITQRVIINNEPVGQELGIDYGTNSERDFFAQGNCDNVFLDLICELGWLQDLNEGVDNLPQASVDLMVTKKRQLDDAVKKGRRKSRRG